MIASLKFRLAIGAVIAIGMVLLLVWVTLSRTFTHYVVDQYQTEMQVLADSLTASVKLQDGKLTLTAAPSDPRLNLPGGGRYWELEQDDAVLQRSRSLWDTVIEEDTLKPSAYPPFEETVGPDGEPMLVFPLVSTLGEGASSQEFCIFTAFPKAEIETALLGFHDDLKRMLLATAAMLSLAALLQASVGLSPLKKMRERVARIRNGDSATLGDGGPSEVQPLVREIDLLLEERQQALERARARASDLAHGLKTPLTVLSQLAERMGPEDADMAFRQVDLIRQRADRQLQAARLGVERMATADVGELTMKLVQVLKPVTERQGLEWQVKTAGNLKVEADPADVAEAIGNVLDNAAKWARSTIAVQASGEAGAVAISISDDGPGIAPAECEAVLARGFHTGGDTGGGTGLGLAITADIVNAYSATLRLGRAKLGGLEVIIQFPSGASRIPAPV
ncbi:signal transduction histidine kinase [Pararhizobium capsulatum DSM 1112]|uniref:histidine kinase n=1 Tax=Pararhizobium capsulatum DSM 1112 TaxID=1121113 RepID=A0ABU0BNI9_9HYPH|nr:HAMP domain-containing sensor histidine kinase [Pararhizobium capsulatum]MDQ0319827.1 signal transduction histidine kinase [Pararhizobium capsulatum DSM 1112]